ncbi:hypothetical protein BRADI_1g07145v3 [Brachypodium distachyon]|uniref:Uncharacterized protein n=1 Tax=Brachypodium distachyon TaxID=15368 RepID=A0A2K2DIF2_BRADI|nr:hypothetical protein BRADI_1g07145v3 [Brachypodium distachyon]
MTAWSTCASLAVKQMSILCGPAPLQGEFGIGSIVLIWLSIPSGLTNDFSARIGGTEACTAKPWSIAL